MWYLRFARKSRTLPATTLRSPEGNVCYGQSSLDSDTHVTRIVTAKHNDIIGHLVVMEYAISNGSLRCLRSLTAR